MPSENQSSGEKETAGFREDVLSVAKVKELLEKAAIGTAEELVEINSCDIIAGTSKGDNYMGDIAEVRASITKKSRSGEPEEETEEQFVRWIIKLMKPSAEGAPNFARVLGVHERESKMYAQIIPELIELGGRHAAPKFCNFVTVNDVEGQEFIVLEHMGEQGFESAANKALGLDFKHCALVMKWLAEYHALGYLLVDRYPGGTESFLEAHPWLVPMSQRVSEDLEAMAEGAKDNNMENYLLIASLIQEDTPDRDYVGHLGRLSEALDKRLDRLRTSSEKHKKPFSTICHLDPWFNNMLFRYDETEPQEALLLDFQFAGFCHPGNDLAHFFLNSTTGEFRRNNLQDLLRLYYDRLQAVAALNGKDLSRYTFQELSRDYEDGLSVGLTFCIMALPTILAKPEDTVDLGEIDLSDPDAFKKFSEGEKERIKRAMRGNDNMKQRLRDCLDDLIDVGIM